MIRGRLALGLACFGGEGVSACVVAGGVPAAESDCVACLAGLLRVSRCAGTAFPLEVLPPLAEGVGFAVRLSVCCEFPFLAAGCLVFMIIRYSVLTGGMIR